MELAETNSVTLKWVPGHSGIEGNTKADLLAKKGSEQRLVGPEPSCGIAYETARATVRELLRQQHNSHWSEVFGLRQSRLFIHGPSRTRTLKLLQLNKKQLRKVVGLFTGHCQLRKHLNNIGVADDPACRLCGEEDETPFHILCECPVLAAKRHEHFGEPFSEPEDIGKGPINCVLKFVENTGLME